MNKPRQAILIIVCLLIGCAAGWLTFAGSGDRAIQRIVAMSWGDGIYGKAFYGVEVYLKPENKRYSVSGRVWIGRGNDSWHEIGQLGLVDTAEEAVQKWGQINWSSQSLTIGPGDPQPYVLPRAKLESHR